MFLVVGLGNPGSEYENTRHNIGFIFVDSLVAEAGAGSYEPRFRGLIRKIQWRGFPLLILKPQTFMNLSGASVQDCLTFFKIPVENLIVAFDDLDQEFGAVRCRTGGSHGGHNGVRDILAKLGTDKFHRLKVGIGRPQHKSATVNWVLGKLTSADHDTLSESFSVATERLESLLKQASKTPR